VLPVSDSATGDVAGVVAMLPAVVPGFDEPLVECEPQAATAKTNGTAPNSVRTPNDTKSRRVGEVNGLRKIMIHHYHGDAVDGPA